MTLPTISEEQNNVVNCIEQGQNVIVESVAGSGKTTCNIYIAKSQSDKSILLLTYNAKLKMETRDRVQMLGIQNIETHSYHSFCVKYYNNKCFTDYQIISIVKSNIIPLKKFKYDIIILDEAQDISPLYHELVCKIYTDNLNLNAQLCVLGDRAQSIYDFNRADSRFIIYADQVFKLNQLKWSRCELSQSYRITSEMANFINYCMGNNFNIKSDKITEKKPKYIITDAYSESIYSKQFTELRNFLKKYKPEEIFILAPSVKNEKSPVRQLENLIKKNLKNIPVYVPVSDEEKLDEQVLKNKLVFSTFHQAKGLERKVVFIYGFDDSYFKFYKKNKNPKKCPNELYVATTRALEHLVLIHSITNNYLEFLNKSYLPKYVDIIRDGELQLKNNKVTKTFEVSVTDLIKHLPVDVLNNCIEYLSISNINKLGDKINIPFKSEQSQGYESLGEITGTAIPSYLQLKKTGSMSIYKEALQYLRENTIGDDSNPNDTDFIDSDSDDAKIIVKPKSYDLENINLKELKPDELLYIANFYCAKKSGFLYKIYQITNYNWLSQENLDYAYDRLLELNVSPKAKYEQYFEIVKLPELLDKRLYGYVDCIDKNNLYEFKCVNKLENEHYLQLAVYMYLYESNIRKKTNGTTTEQVISMYKTNIPSLVKDMLSYVEINKIKIEKETNPREKAKLEDLNARLMIQISRELNLKENKLLDITHLEKTVPTTVQNNYYLYNILTDQMDQISCSYENLKEMIKYLFHAKYYGANEIPDDLFIKNITSVLDKYIEQMKQLNSNIETIEHDQIEHDNGKIKTNNTQTETVEFNGKKYILNKNKVYSIKKDGTKGKLYGMYKANTVIKNLPKNVEIDV